MDSAFFSSSHRYNPVKTRTIFSTFLSNEAMTSSAMADIAGGRFEGKHLIVDYKGLTRGYWEWDDFLKARNDIFVCQLKKNGLPMFTNKVSAIYADIVSGISVYLGDDSKRTDKKSILTIYNDVCNLYRKLCAHAYAANLLDKNLIEMLIEDMEPLLLDVYKGRANECLLTLTRNPKANFVYNSDLEAIELFKKRHRLDNFEGLVEEHVKKWASLFGGSFYEDDDQAIRDRIKEFSSLSHEELAEREDAILEQYRDAEVNGTRMAHEMNLSEDILKKVGLLRDSILLKETRKLAKVRVEDEMTSVFADMARASGIEANNLRYLLPNEVEDILLKTEGGQMLTDEFIGGLKGRSLFVIENGKAQRFFGEDFAIKLKEFGLGEILKDPTDKLEGKNIPGVFEYKKEGLVACRGHIRAPVKVVLSPDDFHKIEKGDILITSLTTPEYVAIFDKVSGMITFDGGGLTSHPATLAREYKIPSILGVKKLDGVLKDGNIVELDADENMIKILG